jgi:hypothetical protein
MGIQGGRRGIQGGRRGIQDRWGNRRYFVPTSNSFVFSRSWQRSEFIGQVSEG